MTAGHGGLMMLVKLKRIDGVFDAFIDENSARVLLKLEKNKVSCIMRSNNWLIKIGLKLERLKYTVEEYCDIVEQYSMGIVFCKNKK